MSNNPAKYEVLIKKYLRSILDKKCRGRQRNVKRLKHMCTALSCSVNLLLDDVLVTVVIVVCSSSVHTYPDIFESASFFFSGNGFRSHASSDFGSEYRHFKMRSPGWEKKSSTSPWTSGRVNPDLFESDDVANSCLVSYQKMKQIWWHNSNATIARFMAHALNTFYRRGVLGT